MSWQVVRHDSYQPVLSLFICVLGYPQHINKQVDKRSEEVLRCIATVTN